METRESAYFGTQLLFTGKILSDVEALVIRELAMWEASIQTPLTCEGLHSVEALVLEKGGRETWEP